jgi:hypothetical protein
MTLSSVGPPSEVSFGVSVIRYVPQRERASPARVIDFSYPSMGGYRPMREKAKFLNRKKQLATRKIVEAVTVLLSRNAQFAAEQRPRRRNLLLWLAVWRGAVAAFSFAPSRTIRRSRQNESREPASHRLTPCRP